jgi:hypothetical protein
MMPYYPIIYFIIILPFRTILPCRAFTLLWLHYGTTALAPTPIQGFRVLAVNFIHQVWHICLQQLAHSQQKLRSSDPNSRVLQHRRSHTDVEVRVAYLDPVDLKTHVHTLDLVALISAAEKKAKLWKCWYKYTAISALRAFS